MQTGSNSGTLNLSPNIGISGTTQNLPLYVTQDGMTYVRNSSGMLNEFKK